MSKKQMAVTIICTFILTLVSLNLWAIFGQDFSIRGSKILFDVGIEQLFHLGLYVIANCFVWKSIFPKRNWAGLLLCESTSFQVFLLATSGFFAIPTSTPNTSIFLFKFGTFMIGVTLAYVLLMLVFRAIAGTVGSVMVVKETEDQKLKNNLSLEMTSDTDLLNDRIDEAMVLGVNHYVR